MTASTQKAAKSKLTAAPPNTPKGGDKVVARPAKKIGLLSYSGTFLASPIERVHLIREGIPATALVETGAAMKMPREQLYGLLHFPRATVSRKISNRQKLSPEMSERILGLRKLIGQVEIMVGQSGAPEGFSAAEWVAHWLGEPLPALGGQKPGDLMDTREGQELVADLLAKMQSGAYA